MSNKFIDFAIIMEPIFSVDMKVVISIFLPLLTTFVRGQIHNLEGKWDECVGIDSLKTFACEGGYTAYIIDNRGLFVHRDSLRCGDINYALRGKWIMSGNDLEIIESPLITENCSASSLSRKFRINWFNKDLFYSLEIGTTEWKGKRIYTVFKRSE